jgi:hypothetical protein
MPFRNRTTSAINSSRVRSRMSSSIALITRLWRPRFWAWRPCRTRPSTSSRFHCEWSREEQCAGDRSFIVGRDRLETCFHIKGNRVPHARQGVQPHFTVTDPRCLRDDGIDQRIAETRAARLGDDVQSFHLAASVGLDRPETDTAQWLSMIVARKKQLTGWRSILAWQGSQLRGEILVAKVHRQRGCVCVEQSRGRFEIGGRSHRTYLE